MSEMKSISSDVDQRDKNVQGVRELLAERERTGAKETVLAVIGSINEQGIRRAGEVAMPFYATIVLVGILVVWGISAFLPQPLGSVLQATSNLAFYALWVVTPFATYWDCKAASRYLNQNWRLGKLMAVAFVFVSPIFLPVFFVYRIKKMPS